MKPCCRWTAPIPMLMLLIFLTAGPCPAAERLGEAEYTIKIATLAPDGSSWMKIFREMNAELYAKSGNRVKFKIYPGGVLGSEEDVLRKMRVGQVHGCGFTGFGLTSIWEDFRVLNLPRMFHSHEEFDYVLERVGPRLEDEYLKKGYVVLGWSEIGFTYLFSRKSVAGVSDLKQTKPWMWGEDPIMGTLYRSAGISPVSVDIGDVLTGLQTGLLDTVFNTPMGVIALQWFTRLETMTDLPLTFSVGAILVTRKQFEEIPPELQSVVREVTGRHLRRLTLETRRENEESIAVLKGEGLKLVPPSETGRKEFQELCGTVARDFRGKGFSPEIYDLVAGYLAEYRSADNGQE